MERLKKRMATAGRALERLHEIAIKEDLSDIERDALIQRFEFCFELIWKCGKDYLQRVEGLEAASPKKAMRLLRETGLLDEHETELALKMADDRNMTVHTYDEVFAQNLISRISAYELLMHDLFRRMLEHAE